jgi:cell wall-associated NlpC family hydrolase
MRRIIPMFFLLIVLVSAKYNESELELREKVITTAAKLLGTPYRSGGTSENGFDCSGFVSHVLKENNIRVSRSSAEQIANGIHIPVSEVKPGDILIFKGASKNSSRPGHSGLVHHISPEGVVHFIHSSSSLGITIDNLDAKYYKDRFLEARDVISGIFTSEP